MKAIHNDADTLRQTSEERYQRTVELHRTRVFKRTAKIALTIISLALLCAGAALLRA